MSKSRTQAPWEFLLSASRNTLQSYELSRLAHAANLRKEITVLLDQWLEETSAANVARWLINQRQLAANSTAAEQRATDTDPASDNSFTDLLAPLTNPRHDS